jgi:hypothetical protein
LQNLGTMVTFRAMGQFTFMVTDRTPGGEIGRPTDLVICGLPTYPTHLVTYDYIPT